MSLSYDNHDRQYIPQPSYTEKDNLSLQTCQFCDRNFFPVSLLKHQVSCERSWIKKNWKKNIENKPPAPPSVFTNVTGFNFSVKSMAEMLSLGAERRKRWRMRREEFIHVLLVAKAMRRSKESGEPIMIEPLSANITQTGMTQCVYCGRRFNEAAFDKHQELCKEIFNNAPVDKTVEQIEAKDRYTKRMKYNRGISSSNQENNQVSLAGDTPNIEFSGPSNLLSNKEDSKLLQKLTTEFILNPPNLTSDMITLEMLSKFIQDNISTLLPSVNSESVLQMSNCNEMATINTEEYSPKNKNISETDTSNSPAKYSSPSAVSSISSLSLFAPLLGTSDPLNSNSNERAKLPPSNKGNKNLRKKNGIEENSSSVTSRKKQMSCVEPKFLTDPGDQQSSYNNDKNLKTISSGSTTLIADCNVDSRNDFVKDKCHKSYRRCHSKHNPDENQCKHERCCSKVRNKNLILNHTSKVSEHEIDEAHSHSVKVRDSTLPVHNSITKSSSQLEKPVKHKHTCHQMGHKRIHKIKHETNRDNTIDNSLRQISDQSRVRDINTTLSPLTRTKIHADTQEIHRHRASSAYNQNNPSSPAFYKFVSGQSDFSFNEGEHKIYKKNIGRCSQMNIECDLNSTSTGPSNQSQFLSAKFDGYPNSYSQSNNQEKLDNSHKIEFLDFDRTTAKSMSPRSDNVTFPEIDVCLNSINTRNFSNLTPSVHNNMTTAMVTQNLRQNKVNSRTTSHDVTERDFEYRNSLNNIEILKNENSDKNHIRPKTGNRALVDVSRNENSGNAVLFKFCPQCGERFAQDARYCTLCGLSR